MGMVILFFVLAAIGAVMLMFHILLEMNTLEKRVEELIEQAGKHYES